MGTTAQNNISHRRDYRDLAIEDACADLVIRDERIASLEADTRTYHELTVQAIEKIRVLTFQYNRLQRDHYQLLDAYRRLRAQTMRESIAA